MRLYMKDGSDSAEKMVKQLMMNKGQVITMDDAANILKDSPDMLALFESVYKKSLDEKESKQLPTSNSKKMTEIAKEFISRSLKNKGEAAQVDYEKLNEQLDIIVRDLIDITSTFTFNGDLSEDGCITEVCNKDTSEVKDNCDKPYLESLPQDIRPQISALMAVKDIHDISGLIILQEYKKAVENIGTPEGMLAYHRFRQGVDIMDIDEITYTMMTYNRNTMGNWLPALVKASIGQDYFKIPKTTVVAVPPTVLQLTKLEYESLNKTTRSILNKWAQTAFKLETDGDYFIKTGTYSFKFDFRNVRVKDPKEILEIGEYLCYIHGYANQHAGPLYNPCIYGMSTTNEWVVREFIESKEDVPTIYNGLPLHVEYRVFIDCDTHEVLSIHPYWDPEGMKNHFKKYAKGGNINHIHDYIVFKSYEDKMIEKYNQNKDIIVERLQPIIDKLGLTGQWSLDIMDDGEQLWFIDMAVAEQSTFYESVPAEKRRPVLETWLPQVKPVMPPWYNAKAELMATRDVRKLQEAQHNKAIEQAKGNSSQDTENTN